MNLNSSLAYEILLYLNTFYLGMFVVCEVAMGILKAINVTYPENALLTEFGIFCSLCFVEMIRIFLGRRGNLASKSKYYENCIIEIICLAFASIAKIPKCFFLQLIL